LGRRPSGTAIFTTIKEVLIMTDELRGRKVAILATDGMEQVEYEQPRQAVEDAGATATLVSLKPGEIQAMNGDIDKGDRFPVEAVVADVSADDFDALILPGGTMNPDRLRVDLDAVAFVRAFAEAGKPIGAICHGPWTLVEAGVVRGRTLTSYPSIRTDLRNAGAEVVDREVVTDQGLVTSRNPDDLPAFCAKIIEEFAEGRHPAAVS
jgi:protease I